MEFEGMEGALIGELERELELECYANDDGLSILVKV